MRYYSEKEIESLIDRKDFKMIQMKGHAINVRFCRDCPHFQELYWQDSKFVKGYCKKLSDELVDDPIYFYVKGHDFCNGDEN